VFGTIFSTELRSHLRGALSGPLGHHVGGGGRLTGAQVLRLPQPLRADYQHAYVHSLRPVFVMAAAVAAVGFALSLLLQERPLRDTAAASTGLEDALAAPRSSDSLAEIERALTNVTTPDERGLIAGEYGHGELTPAGREHTQRVVSARRDLLAEALADDSAERRLELAALLQRLARELSGEPPAGTTTARA
jgi:hypothetical protein